MASAVPVMVGVVLEVMLSVFDDPVSDSAVRSSTGAVGATLSMVIERATDAAEVFPSASEAVTVTAWTPVDNAVGTVKVQLPSPFATAVPSRVAPS